MSELRGIDGGGSRFVAGGWLRSAVRTLRGAWLIVLVGAVLGAALGWLYSATQRPAYESSAVLYQTPQVGDSDGAARQRTQAYVELLTSERLIRAALGASGIPMSVEQVQRSATAAANSGSPILTVTVSADDPARSAKLADALANALPNVVAELDGNVESSPPPPPPPPAPGAPPEQVAPEQITPAPDAVRLSLITPAAPGKKTAPLYVRNVVLGLIAGLLAAVVGSHLRASLSGRVDDPEELGRFLSHPILAAVPYSAELSNSGIADFARHDSDSANAFRRLRADVGGDETVRKIVVASPSEGEGKTTVAANLAVVLGAAGATVVLVDANRPDGAPDGTGLANYLDGRADSFGIETARRYPGVSVVVTGAHVELMSSPRLNGVLSDLAERFDYVIVDTPAVDGSADALVLGRAVDAVLIVARASDTRYAELGAVLDDFDAAEVPRLGVVLNAYPRKKWPLRPRRRAGRSSSEALLTGRRGADVAAE